MDPFLTVEHLIYSQVDRDLFEELHYYFRFAAAAYGWKGYVMVHGAKGCLAMAKECRLVARL